jgi:hypothetical protein
VFQTKHDLVGAICDEDLLGKELEDKKVKIKVSKHFYGGVLVSEKVAVRIMGKVTIGNIIGKEVVDAAVRGGFITEENIILIDGVPHAQFVKI